MSLSEFLLARIAERERDAYRLGNGPAWLKEAVVGGREFPANEAARRVDEYKALRRIVAEHDELVAWNGSRAGVCSRCHDDEHDTAKPYPCPTLRFLALPHADHPDYRNEWKP